MTLVSLFSGLGSIERALTNMGVSIDLVAYCEINPLASKAYSILHSVSEEKNLWDVTKVDTSLLPQDVDLLTYGFPCQDVSLAGERKGMFSEDESGSLTRSGLAFEAARIIRDVRPKVALMENVRGLVTLFVAEFNMLIEHLSESGYTTYWSLCYAYDFDIPQLRPRVFAVSIRDDIDNGLFMFPSGSRTSKSLRDIVEAERVGDRYYYDTDYAVSLFAKLQASNLVRLRTSVRRAVWVGTFNTAKQDVSAGYRVYSLDGYAPTLLASRFGFLTRSGSFVDDYGVRIMTPLECFRLMGFLDSDYALLSASGFKAYALVSLLGNSIVVNVVQAILERIDIAVGICS